MKREALSSLVPEIIKATEELYLHKTICDDGEIRLSYSMIPYSTGSLNERRCPITLRSNGNPLTKEEAEYIMLDDLVKKKMVLDRWIPSKYKKEFRASDAFNALLLFCYRVGMGNFQRSPVGRAIKRNKSVSEIHQAFFECEGDPEKRKQEAELFIEGEKEVKVKEQNIAPFKFVRLKPNESEKEYSREDVKRLVKIGRKIKSKRELGLITSAIVDITIRCFSKPFSKSDVSSKVLKILAENNARDFVIDRNIASYHFDQKKIDQSIYLFGGDNRLSLFYHNEKNIVELMGCNEYFQYSRDKFSIDYEIKITKENTDKELLNKLNPQWVKYLSTLIDKNKKRQTLYTRSKQLALNYLISNLNQNFTSKQITAVYNDVFKQKDKASSLTLVLMKPLFFKHLILDESDIYKKTE